MFVRREVYDALGGFDPDFFLYSEETDLCLRVRKLGHEIGFVDSVEVRHIGGATEQERDPYDVMIQRMNGQYLFWKKHYHPEDVAFLVRYDQLRSVRRIVGYGLLSLFRPRPSPAWRSLRQWQAIWKAASAFLAQA
jgi:GT2 family glycosyltransferase